MRYFVLSEDDKKYGPADLSLLNQWIEEGRLMPDMRLLEEGTNHPVVAASVSDLDFYVLEGAGKGTFDRSEGTLAFADGPAFQESEQVDLLLAWISAALSIVLAFIHNITSLIGVLMALFGLAAAFKAKDRGHPLGSTALAANVLGLAIWAVVRAFHILLQR